MPPKSGLLVVNLGSPNAPNTKNVRTYLGEFLHDWRIIDTSRWIWCPILHGIILRVRPSRSAKKYADVWHLPENLPDGGKGQEAPLVRITRDQVEGLQKAFGDKVIVETAMRYGNPSIGFALDRLMARGCTRIAVLPMYPQYSASTTASVYDGIAKALKARENAPTLRMLRDYHQDGGYIAALGDSLQAQIAKQGWSPEVILASFHGIPQSYVDKGDPYPLECEATTDLLRKYVGMPDEKLRLTFQSRFGPKEWLNPYTDKTLEALAKDGVKKVTLIAPGFSADCLETLEELSMEAEEIFMEAGGEKFSVVPCLNASPAHIAALAKIAKSELLSGWI